MNIHSLNQTAISLAMPRVLSVGNIERKLYLAVRPLTRKRLTFDLSECQYIEVPVLIYLIALMKFRVSRNLPTFLVLPHEKKVLDFLQIWGFPEAVESAIGVRLSQFTVGENAEYFNHPPKDITTRYAGLVIQTEEGMERLLSKHYFSLMTFRSQLQLFNPAFALTEAAKWRNMGSVLASVLNGPENMFASRIVYEALINAVQHPSASVIQIGSQLRWPSAKIGGKGHFTITFWDDGRGIIDTLRSALDAGRSLLFSPAIAIKTNYLVELQQGFRKVIIERCLSSDREPKKEDGNYLILLASTFPGITSNPRLHAPHPETVKTAENNQLLYPGMGLFLLTNAAVSVYGGKVFIRTGRFRAIFSPSKNGHDFNVNIREYGSWPNFPGNLITVRLPLHGR